jgi:hypothetical protein
MTKDGRPSLLNDIRHFYGINRRESRYLEGHEDAVAFGRCLAWFLNGERVSRAQLTASRLDQQPHMPISDFFPRQRPACSKLLKWRG